MTWANMPQLPFIVKFFVSRRHKFRNGCWWWSGWPSIFGHYYRAADLFYQIQTKERFVEVPFFDITLIYVILVVMVEK